MKEKVLEKFLRYISIDTASDPESESQPSTSKQLDLSRLLVKELREMGINNAELDEWGYVMATIPSNLPEGEDVPAILNKQLVRAAHSLVDDQARHPGRPRSHRRPRRAPEPDPHRPGPRLELDPLHGAGPRGDSPR